MRRMKLPPILSLAILLGGCPNRKTAPRVVFVSPAAAPALKEAPQSSGSLMIQEPAPPPPPPAPVEAQPQETATQKPTVRPRRRTSATESAADTPEPPPDTAPAPTPSAPALEPRESPQQQSELRNRVVQMQQSVQERIRALGRTSMGSVDRKTLDSSKVFLVQSERARDSNDLQRAYNLVRKASLLVDALEQKP